MIVGFSDRKAKAFYRGRRIAAYSGFVRYASRKLDQLDAATSLGDLARPGNRLKALNGRRKGQWSIRINDQWRICFKWPEGSSGPTDVEIVDYLRRGGVAMREPIHPGETLREDLDALGMSASELARRIEVPVNRITEILNGRRAVTGDTALRLGRFFGTSGEFWLNLQKIYELRSAERKNGAAIHRLPTLDAAKHLHSTR